MSLQLGNRLLSAASFVRQDAYLADIGTDHAYLPIFLLDCGRINRAVCSDINEGPLSVAEKNVAEAGYLPSVDFLLSDGAAALGCRGITDYAICGMGGELIANIIEHAPHLFEKGIRLILQPMTRQAYLRRYLAERGFVTVGEGYSAEGGKNYLALAVEYGGVSRKISDFEAEFGIISDGESLSAEKRGYFEGKLSALKKALGGKRAGGEDFSYEAALISEYEERTRER